MSNLEQVRNRNTDLEHKFVYRHNLFTPVIVCESSVRGIAGCIVIGLVYSGLGSSVSSHDERLEGMTEVESECLT
jgi:hypothetical protein